MTGPGDMAGAGPERDDALAAEYALGLLEGPEREAFEARLTLEPGLRDAVAGWQETLAPLAGEVAEAAPRPAVKVRVMDAVWGGAAPAGGLWRSLGFWRGLAVVSTLAAAGLAALVWLEPPGLGRGPAVGPVFVVEIAAEDRSLRLLAAAPAGAGELRVARQAGSAPPGRVLQLWAIAGDAAPVSLGVLPEEGSVAVALPEALRGALPGLVLAVSEEPPGGSPTGAPTGAVLAAGEVTGL